MGLFSGPWQSKEEHERGVHLNLISRVNSLELIAYEQGAKLQVAQGRVAELEAENHELKVELGKWVQFWRDKDNKALQARIAELEAALAPFADPNCHWTAALFSKAVVEAARKAMEKSND